MTIEQINDLMVAGSYVCLAGVVLLKLIRWFG